SGGDTGGAKTHVLTLLSNLRSIGVEAELLCIMEGVFTREAEEMGIPVKIIPQKRRYDITVTKKIIEYIRESGCDLIHCHGARANYIALFLRMKIRQPMITTLHSDYKLDFKDNRYKQLVFASINAFALRRFEHILSVTQAFKDMLCERGFDEKKIKVIYNGIDCSKEPEFIGREEFLGKYGIEYDEKKKYVGIAARFFAVKGVIYFLEAAKKICGKKDDVIFIIAGSGDLENEYREFIKKNSLENRVFMIGHIKDINSFYNAIDVNTLTSLSESFPYALLEGAIMGKATVAAAVGGIVEMIEDGKTGFLFKKADVDELSEKICMLTDDDGLREQMGKNFREKVKRDFSAETMAKTHKRIYRELLDEKGV
ncbi:MAG: glycosyltransferase family 4 protein, partial [Firmicutes bacterium]|nr:glycosyltransferase family 4 protein [Bacillota bacterium]